MDEEEALRRLGKIFDAIDEQTRKPGEPSLRKVVADHARDELAKIRERKRKIEIADAALIRDEYGHYPQDVCPHDDTDICDLEKECNDCGAWWDLRNNEEK